MHHPIEVMNIEYAVFITLEWLFFYSCLCGTVNVGFYILYHGRFKKSRCSSIYHARICVSQYIEVLATMQHTYRNSKMKRPTQENPKRDPNYVVATYIYKSHFSLPTRSNSHTWKATHHTKSLQDTCICNFLDWVLFLYLTRKNRLNAIEKNSERQQDC